MNLDVITELLRKQMPDAGEEAIQAAAKELALETTKEEDRRANEAATTSIKTMKKSTACEMVRPSKHPSQRQHQRQQMVTMIHWALSTLCVQRSKPSSCRRW